MRIFFGSSSTISVAIIACFVIFLAISFLHVSEREERINISEKLLVMIICILLLLWEKSKSLLFLSQSHFPECLLPIFSFLPCYFYSSFQSCSRLNSCLLIDNE